MKGNRKMKKRNNGNSSTDLFKKIKLEMFRKIHGLSEKDDRAGLASLKFVRRDQIGSKGGALFSDDDLMDLDVSL